MIKSSPDFGESPYKIRGKSTARYARGLIAKSGPGASTPPHPSVKAKPLRGARRLAALTLGTPGRHAEQPLPAGKFACRPYRGRAHQRVVERHEPATKDRRVAVWICRTW